MRLLIKYATKQYNLTRSVKVAIVVGTILAFINHYQSLIELQLTPRALAQVIITYFVPFLVSLYGASMACRQSELSTCNLFETKSPSSEAENKLQ